jgi:hypothetical protein
VLDTCAIQVSYAGHGAAARGSPTAPTEAGLAGQLPAEDTVITGSRNDLFILRLPEHSGGGYLWDIDQLKETSFAVVRDEHEAVDPDGVGSNPTRRITIESHDRQAGALKLLERRPWQPEKAANSFAVAYDLSGPEMEGYSRAERRRLLEAA